MSRTHARLYTHFMDSLIELAYYLFWTIFNIYTGPDFSVSLINDPMLMYHNLTKPLY